MRAFRVEIGKRERGPGVSRRGQPDSSTFATLRALWFVP
jgi:hypothetical protein